MAIFDATFLVLLLDPEANPPIDPETGQPVTYAKERVEYLIKIMEQTGGKVVVPTPALSEYLVKADVAGPVRLQMMEKRSVFQIASFDKRAAVELAALTREALKDDKFGGVDEPWQKVKLDRQIVAIAKVAGEKEIYSDDTGIRKFAKQAGIKPIRAADLDLPPEDAQRKLDLSSPKD